MRVQFWGVRGSIGVSGSEFLQTGGHTTCVSLEHEGVRLVLDGGTGLRPLGAAWGGPVEASLLFTHVHWDHIQGVPFFGPAFHPDSRLTFIGATGLRESLAQQMRPPQFPITLDAFRAQTRFLEVAPGSPFEVGPFRVWSLRMPHPDGVVCYRAEAGGRTVVFATDVEHGESLEPELLRFAEGADLLVHDAQYTHAEYVGGAGPSRKGWGHSSWEQAVQAARLAEARQVALFHHDPARTDPALTVIEEIARQRHPGAFAAREGLAVAL